MVNDRFFFSLRWKFAILFGTVFLILHSIFSYVSYLEAIDHFALDRKNIESTHIKIANTLTEDSFSVLEQFAELLPLLGELPIQPNKIKEHAFTNLDENWSQWQLSWDMESIVFFDRNAVLVKSWGMPLIPSDTTVKQVLRDEMPAYRLLCSGNCYLQVVIPVIGKSEVIGAFSVIRSFADAIIKYKSETNSDIGLLVAEDSRAVNDKKSSWPFRISGLTPSEKNMPLYQYISKKYSAQDVLAHSKRVHLDGAVFEVRLIPINHHADNNALYFLLIDDITAEIRNLNMDLKQVWFHGVLSLTASLILLILVIHIALRRVTALATALPLLSRNQYGQFRNQIARQDGFVSGYDELDRLNNTALTLTDQLENLEQEVRSNTLKLLEKSQELANQRDFVKQLLEAAPIIILTQKLNGMILTINQAGLDEFEADSHSIIGKVFDLYLPEKDGEHLTKLNQLRTVGLPDQIQIDGSLITETGRQRDISWLHKLFKRGGAQDQPVILTLGVDHSERKLYEQAILNTAAKDYLTGLSNRKKFQEDLDSLLSSAHRYQFNVAMFYLEVDQFKSITNQNGHEAGDKVLVLVASQLKEVTRMSDMLSRLELNRFAFAVSHADINGIKSIAEKLMEKFKSLAFSFAGKEFPLSASIGIAIYPDHGLTVNELFSHADFAMLQAKSLGSGKYHIFSPDVDYQLKLDRMRYWSEMLENALSQDKFTLFFQPIVHIESNVISHYECLLRLQLDDGQLLLPRDFIIHAEELGLIGKIDRLVIKKAVQRLLEFKRQGLDIKVSINLSGRLFSDAAIFEEICHAMGNPEVEPEKIIFEINETAAVSNFAAAESLIMQIKALGCVLALDEFGVGFSSFYYLKNLPIDYVKIDGSFIRKIYRNESDRLFVKAISDVAHAFGKKTVAEYVENKQIMDMLIEFKIDYAQGYYIGKPRRSI